MPPPAHVLGWFSQLVAADSEQTSDEDYRYNCFGYAAGSRTQWWEPREGVGFYWPDVPMELSLDAFRLAYASIGYAVCVSADLEEGIEKIAIFAYEDETPTHAARQLENGMWTSKLGEFEDISHRLHQLEGSDPAYGTVRLVMWRRRAA